MAPHAAGITSPGVPAPVGGGGNGATTITGGYTIGSGIPGGGGQAPAPSSGINNGGLVFSNGNGSWAPLTITLAPSNPLLTINGGQTALSIAGIVDIYRDGTIVYGPNYTPDKAAEAMWDAIAQFSPIYKENEELKIVKDLNKFPWLVH